MDNSVHLKYLAASPEDLLWGVAVSTVGTRDIAPGTPSQSPEQNGNFLQEYRLVYITEGSGRFTSPSLGKWIRVKPGTMILLFPGEWHSYSPDTETGWHEYLIGFHGPMADSLVGNGFFTKERPACNIGIREDITGLYRSAIDTASRQESGFQPLLGSIVIHLLGLRYFHERNETHRSTELSAIIGRAKVLIAERYKDIKPEDVAESLHMGYSNFRKIFRDYTGFSPAKYIQEVRIGKTKEALANTTLSIKEISSRMGFDNYEYFFTAFKRMTGMTPADYRSLMRGNHR